ncbi:hypothetical protein SKUN_001211 [Spiroplasma kunkelii CR2-3x]|uniref:Uncharacterized protein n=1 Tax=Spiroplasma kunkelii CR2-3x TaxID=273035 RepID=A0A0K2JIL9_SPIKU|nr:pentapeptide repeat-containing protein [Spiroplasma kunkelii]ALA98086.1 hypothetical protein SKUN_001211 [Spiroplasma kunkelii CR2-3x]
MKTLQYMIKDLTGVTVEEQKINEYLDLQDADLFYAKLQYIVLRRADLKNIEITKNN